MAHYYDVQQSTKLSDYERAVWAVFGDPYYRAPLIPWVETLLARIQQAIYEAKQESKKEGLKKVKDQKEADIQS